MWEAWAYILSLHEIHLYPAYQPMWLKSSVHQKEDNKLCTKYTSRNSACDGRGF
jgi:hypothetical protein